MRNMLLLADPEESARDSNPPPKMPATKASAPSRGIYQATGGPPQATGALLRAVELALCAGAALNLNVNLNFVTRGHLCSIGYCAGS